MLRKDLKLVTIDYLRESNQISVRAANCCVRQDLKSLYDIVSCFEKHKSFLKVNIKYAGKLTCKELDKFCEELIPQLEIEKLYERNKQIMQILNDLSENERDTVFALINLILESDKIIKRKERIYGHYCSELFFSDFYDKHCHLPMFWILEQYIKNDKSREIDILTTTFDIFKNQQKHTLEELATKHDLTRERVRQIRNSVFHKTFEITAEIIEYNKSDLVKYGILLQNKDDWSYLLDVFMEIDIVSQESFEIQNYLKEEKCNFSVEFALQIIAYIFREKYSLWGGIDISNKVNIWDNTFLIKNEYSNIFDFGKMKEEFCNILIDSETEYLLDIEDYIANSQCWIKYDFNKTDDVICIVRDILLYEFHLYSDDIEGRIKIPANKERKPIDVIYEILQQNGKPMHLDDIFKKFKNILPEHKYKEATQLRPYLQKHDSITFINRKSVYTLKEWEHIRTGTIRDAILEFLSEKELPQSVEDITKYVIQFFSTNQKSIHSTMISGKSFKQFKNGLFGLKGKEYLIEFEEDRQETQRKSFSQRLFELEKFIIESDHFPFSTSKNKNEESLYRWWLLIINGTTDLTNDQKNEVERIMAQYNDFKIDKKTYEWNLHSNKLKKFLLENRRISSGH